MISSSASELYTPDQYDYVAHIKDADLRAELLYQIRLRNLMESDRNAFEKRCNDLTEQVIELKQLIAKEK